MVKLSDKIKTTQSEIHKLTYIEHHRPYLGISIIGHSCMRYLWYSFRWCYPPAVLNSRKRRLFDRGHREEPVLIDVLQQVGITILSTQEECTAVHGHVKGHNDGLAIGVIEAPKTEHILEFKTMNDASFKTTCKTGVKQSKPVYYAQTQLYMKYFNKTRALFIAVNKNDDSLYIERIKYNKHDADNYAERAENIVLSEKPPERKFASSWYECKWCDAKEICHGNKEIETTCRSCKYCDILPQGKWECSLHDISLSTSQQRLACKKYEIYEI